MRLVKSGAIANVCQPNALMTLKEYLEDYASEDTKNHGERMIMDEVETLRNPDVKRIVREHLSELKEGKRDFRF